MNPESFREEAHKLVDWMADFMENIESMPVKPKTKPNDILNQLPTSAPQKSEGMEDIFQDFKDIVVPGMTQWQHPSFHAYFPANSSPAAVLAEMLTATLGTQCMVWSTSPAATELEQRTMEWLHEMLGLPDGWVGSIQNGASDATLNALLTAREKRTKYSINNKGYQENKFRVYCSEQAHSSLDKAVAIAGIGKENLVKIEVDDDFAMIPEKLNAQIEKDIEKGFEPLFVLAALGTTGSTAIDPLEPIADITTKYDLWLHIDAALAGTALILKEYKWMMAGAESADSFVFNPHKWMFTNFDCSAYFVKDKEALINTFSVMPEYLKTKEDSSVNNYRDWGVPLGRRFRALKLWFVIRNYGVEGLKSKIKLHCQLAQWFKQQVEKSDIFELLAPVPLNTVCFRFAPKNVASEKLASLNERLLNTLNDSGSLFMTHTKLNGKYTLRMVIGQTNTEQKHVEKAWNLINAEAKLILDTEQ